MSKNNKNDNEDNIKPPRRRKNNGNDDGGGKRRKKQDEEEPVRIFFAPIPPSFLGDAGDGVPNKYKQLKERIINSNMDDKVKESALMRLKNIDSDKQKHLEWFELLLKIHFKKYAPIPVTKEEGEEGGSIHGEEYYSEDEGDAARILREEIE